VYKYVDREMKHVYVHTITINTWPDNDIMITKMSVFCKLIAGHIRLLPLSNPQWKGKN
jgi:hypothetical protein